MEVKPRKKAEEELRKIIKRSLFRIRFKLLRKGATIEKRIQNKMVMDLTF
jgi:hypothetical protein